MKQTLADILGKTVSVDRISQLRGAMSRCDDFLKAFDLVCGRKAKKTSRKGKKK